jgi:SAM-dependent methyltransferase
MNRVETTDMGAVLTEEYLAEYNSDDSIRKYTKATAGYGINYLFDHDYGQIYRSVLQQCLSADRRSRGIRLLEFGCGGGMNLMYLVALAKQLGLTLDYAIGADFSEMLISAAAADARRYLSRDDNEKVRFVVARNECLVSDLEKANLKATELLGSFDLVVGVNTIRYCHRLHNEQDCVAGISSLLKDSGVCVVIDMNDRFPAFRSRLSDWLTKEKASYYVPTLEEYASPFVTGGFEILTKKHFCWVPHSAGPAMTAVMRSLEPMLNTMAPSRAMRSLVIARKGRA